MPISKLEKEQRSKAYLKDIANTKTGLTVCRIQLEMLEGLLWSLEPVEGSGALNESIEKARQSVVNHIDKILDDVKRYKDRWNAFYKALDRLDPVSRDIITERFINQRKHADIARTLCYSTCYVYELQRKALQAFYEVMPLPA